jgi:serine/threonine protein kinase
MATPTTSVTEYCALLARSKLLPAGEAETLHQQWKAETGGGDDQVEAFVAFVVKRRVLTPYQAAMIQRGRADGFFLNTYKILDRIGKGQMGGVYKAVHSLGQVVALKILPSSKAKDPHTLGRFQRESRLLTQLDHPNVVRAFQVGEAGGVHYIAMEFLEGETLDEVLARRKQLPVGEAVRLIRQALDGLQHLHERRMVHRDLKPSNLMLTPSPAPQGKPDATWDATVKIVDIGLGREMFDEGTPEGQIETQLTVEGAVLGTPDYLAPEQARDARSADVRADIYSLGCVLYHCLSGRTPFPDTNIMTQMLKHATEKPAPLREFVKVVPPGLQQVFDRLTAKDPNQRYQTPAAASEALRQFLAPNAGARAAKSQLVPAYREWLETESQMEPRAPLPPEPRPEAAKAGTAPAPAIKAGTGPSRPLPQKPGTAPSPVLASPKPGTGPVVPVAPYAPPARPQPAPLPLDDEVEVELVTMPPPAPAPAVPVAVPLPVPDLLPEDRPLWPPDRRDWLMLAAGGLGVLAAVGVGYGFARLVRSIRSEPEGEKKQE